MASLLEGEISGVRYLRCCSWAGMNCSFIKVSDYGLRDRLRDTSTISIVELFGPPKSPPMATRGPAGCDEGATAWCSTLCSHIISCSRIYVIFFLYSFLLLSASFSGFLPSFPSVFIAVLFPFHFRCLLNKPSCRIAQEWWKLQQLLSAVCPRMRLPWQGIR